MKISIHLQKKLHKRCKFCHVMKPLFDFSNKLDAADGKRGYCRPCDARRQREGWNGDKL